MFTHHFHGDLSCDFHTISDPPYAKHRPTSKRSAINCWCARASFGSWDKGLFSYLPLAKRSLTKIENILRDEMNAIGGQEMTMPVAHPAEVWQATGRWYSIGPEMARFKDRKERDMVLAMTHEEVVTDLCKTEIRSYRQLPQLVYHIQTKFRDDPRPRAGLIRVREFTMKDSYSLDTDEAGSGQAVSRALSGVLQHLQSLRSAGDCGRFGRGHDGRLAGARIHVPHGRWRRHAGVVSQLRLRGQSTDCEALPSRCRRRKS